MVVPSESFEPRAVLQTVQEERCTSLYGVPTMFIAESEVADFDQFNLGSLRTGIMAGAPCPVELMKLVQTRMHLPEITIACGMTETSPLSTQTLPDDSLEKLSRRGPRAHVESKLSIPSPPSFRAAHLEQCTRGTS